MICFKCEKPLERVMEDFDHQPYEACTFTAHGQYGCTVFDPMGVLGQYLMIQICDECLVNHKDRVTLFERAQQPAHVPDVVVPWNPSLDNDDDEDWEPSPEDREKGMAKLKEIIERGKNKNDSETNVIFVDLSVPDSKEISQKMKNNLGTKLLLGREPIMKPDEDSKDEDD